MKKIVKKNQIMIVSLALMIAVAGYLNFAGNTVEEESFALGENTVMDEGGVALLDISEEDIASLDSEYVEMPDQYSDVVMDIAGEEDLSAFISETVDSTQVESQLATEELTDNQVAAQEIAAETMDATIAENGMVAGNDMVIDEVPGEAVFTSAGVANLADARLLKEQTRARNRENLLEIINNVNLTEAQKADAVNSMISLTDMAEREMSAEILLEAKGYDSAVVSITGNSADVCVAVTGLSDVQCAQIIDIVQRKTGIAAENIVITPITQ